MAQTSFASDSVHAKKLWQEKVYRDSAKELFFKDFMSASGDNVVCVKEDLSKQKGDKINYPLRKRLQGAGVVNSTLEGKEEALTFYNDSVEINHYRHAVRDDGAMSRQRTAFSISVESEMAIKTWLAEKQDELIFDALTTDSDPTTVAYLTDTGRANYAATGTAATAKSALTATSILEPNFISYVKVLAKTGGNRTFIPIKPLKIKGKEYFVLLVHPDVLYGLKTDSGYQQALREAQSRGDDNPLFKNAAGIWDGVIVMEHENMPIGLDAGSGSNIPFGKCALLGQHAITWAWAKKPYVVQKKFDFDDQDAYAANFLAGVKRTAFNNQDYGSLGVYVARQRVSDTL